MATNVTESERGAPLVLFTEDIARDLHVSAYVARSIARKIGRKIGGRRWGVLATDLVSYLLERDEQERR